jgi:predicted dehydrogenase
MKKSTLTRRGFLAKAAAVAAAPYIVPASALGRGGATAPSNRIVMASIGTGGMGTGNMRSFMQYPETQFVAVCDVDTERRLNAKSILEEYYAANTASGSFKGIGHYNDFRDVIARGDIDAVSIATPDHWHAIPVIAAAKEGKDIYCEKPLGLTIAEGRAMSDTVQRYGCVFQTGSQLPSRDHIRYGCELVRNGRLGKIHEITAVCGSGPALENQPEMPVPPGFDYEMWLGPAPWAPYTEKRCHYQFRWNLDYSGGQPTDHGAHYCDIGQWGLGTEYTGPVEFSGNGEYPKDGLYNTPTVFHAECVYPSGVKMIVKNVGLGATTFYGSEGMLHIGEGHLESDPPSLISSAIGANEIHLYKCNDHHKNFLDCIKTRAKPIADIERAHRSVAIGHICNMAMQLGRKLRWDPDAERFVNDPEADRMLSRSMRGPWHL